MMFHNEIWDEFQWEAHLNEMEERNDQLRDFITSNLDEKKPRWFRLLNEYNSRLDVMNAFIEEELLIEESYFPDDEDWSDEDEEDEDPLFGFSEEDDEDWEDEEFWASLDDDLDEDDDFEEGEEWKSLTEDYVMSDDGSIENLKVYTDARSYGAELLKIGDRDTDRYEDPLFVDLVSHNLQISAKLAAGYAFGFEVDVLGANITYCKKALAYANQSLEKLQEMREDFDREEYLHLHARLFEIRNDIGVYIQNLREKFYQF